MTAFRKYLRLAVAAGLILAFFSPVFPSAPQKMSVSYALAKRSSRKAAKKPKKKKTKKDSAVAFPVKIIGDAGCVKETNLAFGTLREKSRGDYDKVINSIGVVECAEKGSGVYVWENPPRFKVGRATCQADPLWYASALVHENCHVEQYRNYSALNRGQKVPAEVFSGADAENECLFAQYNALIRIGAGQPLLDYVKKIAETNYWDVPMEKRWW